MPLGTNLFCLSRWLHTSPCLPKQARCPSTRVPDVLTHNFLLHCIWAVAVCCVMLHITSTEHQIANGATSAELCLLYTFFAVSLSFGSVCAAVPALSSPGLCHACLMSSFIPLMCLVHLPCLTQPHLSCPTPLHLPRLPYSNCPNPAVLPASPHLSGSCPTYPSCPNAAVPELTLCAHCKLNGGIITCICNVVQVGRADERGHCGCPGLLPL